MSKRATTIKSVHDPGYQEFQRLARSAIESNRRRKKKLNNAATKIQRKIRQTQRKKKDNAATKIQRKIRQTRRKRQRKLKKRADAATKIANAARRNAAINKKYNIRLENKVIEFIRDIKNTNAAKKFFSNMSEYDKNRFESCLRNCIRKFSNIQRYYTKPGSRFSQPMGQIMRQLSNLSDEDRGILTEDLLRQMSNDTSYSWGNLGNLSPSSSPNSSLLRYPISASSLAVPGLRRENSMDLLYPNSMNNMSLTSSFSPISPREKQFYINNFVNSEDSNNSSTNSFGSLKSMKKGKKSRFIKINPGDSDYDYVRYDSDSVNSTSSDLDEMADFKNKSSGKSKKKKKSKKGGKRKKTKKGGKRKKNPKRGSYNKLTRKQQKKNLNKFFKKRMKILNNGPPRGIISDAWVSKTCPCRDGDDCVPCPYHLKNFKDGRKKTKKNKKFFGLF